MRRSILSRGVEYTLYSCERCVIIIKRMDNIDIYTCRYETYDLGVGDLLGVLMITMLMLAEIHGNIFLQLFDNGD